MGRLGKNESPQKFPWNNARNSVAESIRFFFDQHMWASVAKGLRRHGIDVLTAQDAGRCGIPDPDQLAFATVQERVMVTFDTDL